MTKVSPTTSTKAQTRSNQGLFEVFLARYISTHTQRAYSRDWTTFCDDCCAWFDIRLDADDSSTLINFREELVLAWLRESEGRDAHKPALARARKAESRRRALACLAAFASFLCKKGLLEANPMAFLPKIKPTRQAHERSEALTEEEMQRLLSHVGERAQEARNKQILDYKQRLRLASLDLSEVVIWTLLTVGMRVGELIKLRIRDFRHEGQGTRLWLQAKGGGRHDPFVPPQTVQKIRIYLEKYRHNAKVDEPLFIRAHFMSRVNPLTQFGVFKMVSRAAREIGLDKSISPHSLRASLATALIRQQVPLAHVRDLLGHQSIRTTSIYLKRVQARNEAATLQLDVGRLFAKESGEGESS